MIWHSLKPRTPEFISQPLFGDKCQYSALAPLRYQSHSTSAHNLLICAAKAFSAALPLVKYCRTHSKPCTRKADSTTSPPSSFLLNGFTLPVSPCIQCGQAP